MKTILLIGLKKFDVKLDAKLSIKNSSIGFSKKLSLKGDSKTPKSNGDLRTLPAKGDTLKGTNK